MISIININSETSEKNIHVTPHRLDFTININMEIIKKYGRLDS